MSSRVTAEKPFSPISRNAALSSARRRSASWVPARLAISSTLTDRSVRCQSPLLPGVNSGPMRVRVLYFASFRDAVGRDEEVREVAGGSRVRHLWDALGGDVPLFSKFPSMPAAA